MVRGYGRQGRRRAAMVEFALGLVFLTPLLLGTLVYGFRLVRHIEMQITRDLGHMYLRGVNFRYPGPQQNAQTLAGEFALTSSGRSVVLLSRIRLCTQADCDAAGANGEPEPADVRGAVDSGNSSAGATASTRWGRPRECTTT